MEREEKKSRKVLIWILLVVLILAALLLLLFLWRCSPATKAVSYETASRKLDEAPFLAMRNVIRVQYTPEGQATEEITVTALVKLVREGDDLQMESVNIFDDAVGQTAEELKALNADGTEAWYRDGWLYLRNFDSENGSARDLPVDQIYNIYTSGRVVLPPDQILSETSKKVAGGTLITQVADPVAAGKNTKALLGTMASIMGPDATFSELTLTMLVNDKGYPVEFSSHLVGQFTEDGLVRTVVMDSTSTEISFDPITIDFPPQDVLDAFEKEYQGNGSGTSSPPAAEPGGVEPGATSSTGSGNRSIVTALLPEGMPIERVGDIAGQETFFVRTDWPVADTVAWLRENLPARGAEVLAVEAAQTGGDTVFNVAAGGATLMIVVSDDAMAFTFM